MALTHKLGNSLTGLALLASFYSCASEEPQCREGRIYKDGQCVEEDLLTQYCKFVVDCCDKGYSTDIECDYPPFTVEECKEKRNTLHLTYDLACFVKVHKNFGCGPLPSDYNPFNPCALYK